MRIQRARKYNIPELATIFENPFTAPTMDVPEMIHSDSSETRYYAYGWTTTGWYVVIWYCYRGDGVIIIIGAFTSKNVKGTRIMTVYDLQLQLLKFQEEGLRLLQLCGQYPGIPVLSIPGYDAWLNNLYQYEKRYLSGHQTHDRFQFGFGAAGNPQVGLTQLLQCLDIVNKDQLFWDDLKRKGLSTLENGVGSMYGENIPQQVDNQSGLFQQVKPTVFLSYNWGSDKTADEVEKRLKPFANVLRDKSSIGPCIFRANKPPLTAD